MAKINPYYMQIGQADREKEELEKKRKKAKEREKRIKRNIAQN